ncbi:MAG: hypothetical protein ACREMI_06510 [Gemmatimonadales bacterium]
MFRVSLAALALAVAAAAGCGRRAESDAQPEPESEWSLTVINRHSLDVSIHVISDGQRTYAGTVGATRRETYMLAPRLVGAGRSVRLEASAIGSHRRLGSETLLIRGGQNLEWTLENGLERASVVIW